MANMQDVVVNRVPFGSARDVEYSKKQLTLRILTNIKTVYGFGWFPEEK
jgi:hypothetical protein